MGIINVNGTELELDLMDADVMEKFENLCGEIADKIQEPTQYEGLSGAESMRKQCRYVDRFFDDLFGEGTAKAIFHGKMRLDEHMEAFALVTSQRARMEEDVQAIASKYGVHRLQNREARRASKKRGKFNRQYARRS